MTYKHLITSLYLSNISQLNLMFWNFADVSREHLYYLRNNPLSHNQRYHLTYRLIRALLSQKRVDPYQVNVLLRKLRPKSRSNDVIFPTAQAHPPVVSPPPIINIHSSTIGGVIGYKVSPIQEIPAPNLSRYNHK